MSELRTALVIDGEAPMRKLVATYCEKSGYQTTLANDSIEALIDAESASYHLIITSYQLKSMNGIELCRQLRTDPRHKETRMIMITAMADRLDKNSLRRELSLIVLPKPLDLAGLVQLIVNPAKPAAFDPA